MDQTAKKQIARYFLEMSQVIMEQTPTFRFMQTVRARGMEMGVPCDMIDEVLAVSRITLSEFDEKDTVMLGMATDMAMIIRNAYKAYMKFAPMYPEKFLRNLRLELEL